MRAFHMLLPTPHVAAGDIAALQVNTILPHLSAPASFRIVGFVISVGGRSPNVVAGVAPALLLAAG